MNKGFTLIELFVTMTIIGILSSILFLGNRTAEKKLALGRAAFVLAQDLREIQEMAMGAGEIDCNGDVTHSFGINFDMSHSLTSYYWFADCDESHVYDESNDKLLREVKLEKGIQIKTLSPLSPLNIVFSPPDPKIYINGNDWNEEGKVTLEFESGDIKVVKVNSAGRIEIEYPKEETGCFIATAVYGTPLAPQINILRDFRDEILLRNELGKKFVAFYYRNSPPLANFISQHSTLRKVIREISIEPIIEIIKFTKPVWSNKQNIE